MVVTSAPVGLEGGPGSFSYSAKPQAVPSKRSRPKYRADEGVDNSPFANNIMYDRRVVRGNTYQAQVVTSNQQLEAERMQKDQATRLNHDLALRRRADMNVPGTPPPVNGRHHMDAQTDQYLEELTDRPIEKDADTQTQSFLDRPPSPLFVPAKCGLDKPTQIEVGDLFDFNTEVVPILEVLVGKTLEVAMFEVLEEEELDALKKRQQDFEKLRNAELAEVQRLEAEAKRKDDEKLRRLEQEKDRVQQERTLEEKVAARSFARQYLTGLEDTIFEQLKAEGIFYDPLNKEVELLFLPWVLDKVIVNMAQAKVAEAAADAILADSLDAIKKLQAEAKAARAAEEARLARENQSMASEEELVRAKAKADAAAPAEGEGGEGGTGGEGGAAPEGEEA